jgi:hypothetical protein
VPSVATFEATVTVTPESASIELDGQQVGVGTWTASLPRDGRAHTLRVSAEGHTSAELTFTDEPPPATLTLERTRRVGAGGRPGGAGASSAGASSGTASTGTGSSGTSGTGMTEDTTMAGPQQGANGSFILQ